jgi:hypothetical protein
VILLSRTQTLLAIYEKYEALTKEELNGRVKDAINDSGRTGVFIASKLDMTRQSYYNWMKEIPTHKIHYYRLLKICDIIGKDIEEILK